MKISMDYSRLKLTLTHWPLPCPTLPGQMRRFCKNSQESHFNSKTTTTWWLLVLCFNVNQLFSLLLSLHNSCPKHLKQLLSLKPNGYMRLSQGSLFYLKPRSSSFRHLIFKFILPLKLPSSLLPFFVSQSVFLHLSNSVGQLRLV